MIVQILSTPLLLACEDIINKTRILQVTTSQITYIVNSRSIHRMGGQNTSTGLLHLPVALLSRASFSSAMHKITLPHTL